MNELSIAATMVDMAIEAAARLIITSGAGLSQFIKYENIFANFIILFADNFCKYNKLRLYVSRFASEI